LLTTVAALIVSFRTADAWQKYTSSDGHFSITFPGKPEESAEDDKTSDGQPFKIHYVTLSPTDEVYMVGWINMVDFYPADKSMKQILEDSRDGATESMKATDVKTLKTNLTGEPYIEFTFKTDKFKGKDRIYVISKFQYSVITIFSEEKGIGTNADKFIGSFRHTN
jgi:hypothetical protein